MSEPGISMTTLHARQLDIWLIYSRALTKDGESATGFIRLVAVKLHRLLESETRGVAASFINRLNEQTRCCLTSCN